MSRSGEACSCPSTDATRARCPVSNSNGKPVARKTPESLLRDPGRLGDGPFFFCRDPDCEVVYFSACGEEVYKKRDLAVRVGLKETEDPIPVCYCFEFTAAMLREEIEQAGETTIPQKIKEGIAAGRCACDVRNPQGSCCLGDVNAAVKTIGRGLGNEKERTQAK